MLLEKALLDSCFLQLLTTLIQLCSKSIVLCLRPLELFNKSCHGADDRLKTIAVSSYFLSITPTRRQKQQQKTNLLTCLLGAGVIA